MKLTTIHIVFDGPPGPQAGRFVETETDQWEGIGVGRWIDRGNGYWALELDVPEDSVREAVR